MTGLADAARPALRVISGEPTPEELAVVTALMTAAAAGDVSAPATAARGGWADPAWALRVPLPAGPGAWHASLR